MRPGYGKVFALVINLPDKRGVSVHAFLSIQLDGIIAPRLLPARHSQRPLIKRLEEGARNLPELVRDLDIFFGDGISLIVRPLPIHSNVLRSRVHVSGYNVPSQSTTGQMIHCAEAASK